MKAPQILSGFQDLLPGDMIARNKVMSMIKAVFESHGFEPIETPSLEYYETLTGKEGGESEMLMYDFTDHGDRHVGLIYDLTVPISRVMATYQDIPKPFKRYQIQRVYRAERPQKGRFREFYQCDVDIFGTASPLSDAEIVSILSDSLFRMGFKDFNVLVNHRGVMQGIMRACGVPKEILKESIIIVDKLDKVGPDGVAKELEAKSIPSARRIVEMISVQGDISTVISKLKGMLASDEEAVQALDNIRQIIELAGAMNARVKFDPSLARGQSYYTGPVFEARLETPKIGSVAGGGRYDNLIGIFSGNQVCATGASLGIDRIMAAMREIGMISDTRTIAKIQICHFGEGSLPLALECAKTIRESGIPCDLYCGDGDIRKQIKYASKKGVPYIVIIGEDEARSSTVLVKNMETGEQEKVEFSKFGEVASQLA
ncbi:MAG: histidine--tRNA ligase [Caldisericia bacterium]|jgi:histidyl-tRNA synthetase|nr:histidine--tRNA ligase [Caldisericia bacterium]NMD14417.1 histidine--tRNA ligase [Caldisericales bacterium]